MARSQSSTFVKFLGVGAAVIAGGAAFGYLFGSTHLAHPAKQTTQPPVSATLTPAPKMNPSAIHPHMANGNYTAPGAPHITIEEQSQPILRRVTPPLAPAADPEAAQEATPTPKTAVQMTTPSDTTSQPPADTGSPAPTPDTSSSPASPAISAPPSPAPVPADPDFEHVNSPKPAGSPDPESGQQGGSPNSKTPGDRTQNDSTRAQFRVQTGAYTDESTARSAADTLRGQGYLTSTRSERDGDHLVYKVQVGAYRSKIGASKAADDLQKKGYSAFISPMTP